MNRSHAGRMKLLCGVAPLLLLAAGTAHAETAAAETIETAGSDGAGEIVVTANKREQSINKVGLAITALSGDALRSQRVVSLADLANTIPGLSYAPSATQTPVYTLRGVGFYETSLAAYPTTSVYVDQVPLPFPALSTHASFDLERVEVLKGPQGTLFGQNSTGGAINFIAAKPTDTFAAGGDISYGRFNRVEGNAYVSGPLSGTIKARLALTGARADDWQYSYTRKDKLGEVGYYAGRLIVDWQASERLDFEVNLNGWRDKSDPQAPQYQTLLSQSPTTTVPGLRAFPFSPFEPRAADWTPSTRPHADNRLLQGSVRGNWEVVDGVTVTAISSYVDYKPDQGFETDGTTLMADDFIIDRGRIKSFSQELRVANSDRSDFRWVVGANYEKSHVYEYQLQTFSDISTAPVFGYTGAYVYSDQHMRNYAFFANGEYDLSDRFTVKAGARYTNARRRAATCTGDPGDGSFAAAFDGLANAIQLGFFPVAGFTPTGVPVPPIGGGCAPLDNTTEDGTPATYLPGEFNDTLKEDNISWRVGLDYKPASNVLLYVNAAKGYKAGSFPIASAATFEQFLPVTQESLMSYEAGFKLTTLDRKLQVSGAAFYYDYKNKQLRSKIVDPIFGVLDALDNIPKSRMIGVELDSSFTPVRGLTLGASGSILDSKITRFVGLDTAGGAIDYSGAVIPYTPKYQLRLSADYVWDMGSAQPFVGIVFSTRSKALANIGGSRGLVITSDFASSVPVDRTYTIPGYSLVDVRAGARFNDGQWSVTLFGKNVFNKYYVTNIFTDYDTIARFAGQPATYGVTFAFKFQ
ncbi:TonB-dependent receptor plug domain-containing protein [Sphingomonas histidinilytica]|uniref:Outer membrane receptor proteins, mostly Fe transport n=1 Tax=Rhizorhabdus histidinilytica TaxID=439228 RepID=A0A1T5CZY1_9SPHN|nr:TonB-dependent receptor [Rhizorhabdus histidinilytica]MBO9376371.1 TonB-dependent receptor plug domain-containing protein [Rhizorhabdus histidinilytica]SKB65035.1 Outer membrane receptor proteins, mostly Fe transport [Rhizorhabdus histidinilytica]